MTMIMDSFWIGLIIGCCFGWIIGFLAGYMGRQGSNAQERVIRHTRIEDEHGADYEN